MSSGQKIIKYCALAFAIALIVGIFKGIFEVGYHVVNGIDIKTSSTKRNYDNASSYLDIDVAYADLKIISGDAFKVETENENVEVKQDENKLTVKEKKASIFKKNKEKSITVYIPESLVFDISYIDTGAGKIEIDSLNTKNLKMNLGAGKAIINNIIALNSAKIDTGAGDVSITGGNYNNLDIDLGVGNANIEAVLTGLTKIDCGIGNLNLDLIGDPESYTVEVDKGLGKFTLDGEELSTNEFGTGANKITINGAIGNINIKRVGTILGA